MSAVASHSDAAAAAAVDAAKALFVRCCAALARVCDAVTADEGGRGIRNLMVTSPCVDVSLEAADASLPPAARAAYVHTLLCASAELLACPSVCILTGFPCRMSDTPPIETDGPPAAVALAAASRYLRKPNCIVTDTCAAHALTACVEACGCGADEPVTIIIHAFPPAPEWDAGCSARLQAVCDDYVHAIAVERAGVSASGDYCTMRALSMRAWVAPVDSLLTHGCVCGGQVTGDAWRSSTGIGDGGNEAGMGVVKDRVMAHIPRGDVIACVTPCDHLLVASVSNWGGWALLAASHITLHLLVCAHDAGVLQALPAPLTLSAARIIAAMPPHVLDAARADKSVVLLPSIEQQAAVTHAMIAAGVRDGITGALDGSVDGMPAATHVHMLERLRDIACTW